MTERPDDQDSNDKPRASYEPLTQEDIDAMTMALLNQHELYPLTPGRIKRLCAMAGNALLYAEEIQRLRHDGERALANHTADLSARSAGVASEKSQGDPKTANSAVLDPNPTIAELEWLLGAPPGYLTTEADTVGRTTVTLGPRLTPHSASKEFKPWWVPPIRYDKDRGYFLDARGTLIAVARVSIVDHMQEQIAEAMNATTDAG